MGAAVLTSSKSLLGPVGVQKASARVDSGYYGSTRLTSRLAKTSSRQQPGQRSEIDGDKSSCNRGKIGQLIFILYC